VNGKDESWRLAAWLVLVLVLIALVLVFVAARALRRR